MTKQSILNNQSIRKLRPNLWQAPDGAVIGFGTLHAPGGSYFCFTCNQPDCCHVEPVDEAWLSGVDSAEVPFDGEPLTYDGDELVFASSADLWPDDYGLQEPAL